MLPALCSKHTGVEHETSHVAVITQVGTITLQPYPHACHTSLSCGECVASFDCASSLLLLIQIQYHCAHEDPRAHTVLLTVYKLAPAVSSSLIGGPPAHLRRLAREALLTQPTWLVVNCQHLSKRAVATRAATPVLLQPHLLIAFSALCSIHTLSCTPGGFTERGS